MERIAKILDFVNSTATNNEVKQNNEDIKPNPGIEDKKEEQQQINKNNLPIKNNDIVPSTPTEPETTETPTETPTETQNNDIYADNKKYNSLRRKLKKQKIYPCNINDKAFYSQQEVDDYLKVLADNKRLYNKKLRNDKLIKTSLKIDELEHINEDDDVIEDDGYIYTHNKPVGVVKDNKRYKLPTTNKTDRNNIFKEIGNNKEVITKLLKTDDKNEFNNITLNNIHNEAVKKKTQQHINNNIVKDNTWNKNEFIKLMEKKMAKINRSNEEKINRTNIPQRPTTPYNNITTAYNNITTAYNNPIGLNPKLFTRY